MALRFLDSMNRMARTHFFQLEQSHHLFTRGLWTAVGRFRLRAEDLNLRPFALYFAFKAAISACKAAIVLCAVARSAFSTVFWYDFDGIRCDTSTP